MKQHHVILLLLALVAVATAVEVQEAALKASLAARKAHKETSKAKRQEYV
jgi:hypothetical protein